MIPELAQFRADIPMLLATLEAILADREARYPGNVADGKLSAEDAARGLTLSRAMVAEWRWATDPAAPALPPYGDDGHFGILNTLLAGDAATMALRARQKARAAPHDTQASQRADHCEAIAWLQQDQPNVPGISRLSWHESIDRRVARRFAEARVE